MNYKHFREKNAKFHIFLLLSIMGGISLITIYDRKFRHNRPEEGLPKMITYISPINMVAEDNHLYFAYKSPLGRTQVENMGIHLSFWHDLFERFMFILIFFLDKHKKRAMLTFSLMFLTNTAKHKLNIKRMFVTKLFGLECKRRKNDDG